MVTLPPGPVDDHPPRLNRGLSLITALVIEDPFDNCRLVKLQPPDGIVVQDLDGGQWQITSRRMVQ